MKKNNWFHDLFINDVKQVLPEHGDGDPNDAQSMSILDEKENNNKHVPFSDMYNRVYTYLSEGRGDYGRYCLTEGVSPPVDPDGVAFIRGNGAYFGVANNKFDYAMNSLTDRADLSVGSVLSKYANLTEDEYGKHLSINKTSGGQGSITFLHTGESSTKHVFETDMYINMSEVVIDSSATDTWFMSFTFYNEDRTSTWNNQYVRLHFPLRSNRKSIRWYKGKPIDMPIDEWFSLRIECIGSRAVVMFNGISVATYTISPLASFGGVKIDFRTKSYVNNISVDLDNTCLHSVNETATSEATLSSVPQRTNRGHLRVPAFVVGEEPTANDLLKNSSTESYIDEIAVSYKYIQSLREKIYEDMAKHAGSSDGASGITPQFKIEDGELLVSYDNGSKWSSLGNVKGADGAPGKDGNDGAPGVDGVDGKDGTDGNGILSIKKTKTSGLVDTYTITFTNGDTTTFDVVNGQEGAPGAPGKDGNGIAYIKKTKTAGLVDTYTITFTNGESTTFEVTNGKDGTSVDPETGGSIGIKPLFKIEEDTLYVSYDNGTGWDPLGVVVGADGKDGVDGITPQFKIEEGELFVSTDNGTGWDPLGVVVGSDGKDGLDGNGISSIKRTSTDGLIDTYTITFTDGTTSTFTVTNGKAGKDGKDGITPQFKIEEGELFVSYDNESEWNSLGDVKGADGENGKDYILTDSDKEEIAGIVEVNIGSDFTDEQIAILQTLITNYQDSQYVYMSVSITPASSTYEIGSKQTITFKWTFTKDVSSVTFGGQAQTAAKSGSATVANISTDRSFEVKGTRADGKKEPKSAKANVYFYNKYYFGCTTLVETNDDGSLKTDEAGNHIPKKIDSDFIKTLTFKTGWASSRPTFTIRNQVNCGTDKYIWLAYPVKKGATSLGESSFKINGFNGGFEKPSIVSFKNNSDYTEDYYVYRSTEHSLGLIDELQIL